MHFCPAFRSCAEINRISDFPHEGDAEAAARIGSGAEPASRIAHHDANQVCVGHNLDFELAFRVWIGVPNDIRDRLTDREPRVIDGAVSTDGAHVFSHKVTSETHVLGQCRKTQMQRF
jgi:hypothetical protein